MVPNCSPGHDASIGTQRDLPRSNFEVDLSWSLCTMLFVMTSGDLNIDLNQFFFAKVVGLSTSYHQIPFAICRYYSWFSRSDGGGAKRPPRPIQSLSEPARNRAKQ